jgi:RNA polymerase sigma-70 factor (ECF subfamily)
VSRLSPPLRDVVELAMLQDLPYAEVAEILGIPVGTVKSRMFNALKRLKEVFDERGS